MRDQAVAEQRVMFDELHRVNNDANMQSLGNLQKKKKRESPIFKVKVTEHVFDIIPNYSCKRWDGPREHQEANMFACSQNAHRICTRVVGTHHEVKKKGYDQKSHNNSWADGCGLVKPPNSRIEWLTRSRWTSYQTRGFVHDVPASGVATIRHGNYRESGARRLRSAIAKETGKVR